MAEFKERFKTLRKKLGLRQQDMANSLSVPSTTISKYELGLVKPSSELLAKIGMIYDVNLNWLLTGEGPIFTNENNIMATGTDGKPFLRLVKSANQILQVESMSMIPSSEIENIEQCKATDSDNYMINLAKKLNKILTVEYFDNNQKLGVKNFNPNGNIEKVPVISPNKDNEKNSKLNKKLDEALKNPQKREFIEIAIDALQDPKAMEQLKILIKGIELANKG